MAILRILQYPDPRLKTIAKKVTDFKDPHFQKIVDDMIETYYAANNCAALAATQLDIPHPPHLTVVNASPEKDTLLCLVNAVIILQEGEQFEEEGCMSVGCDIGISLYEKVTRAQKIKVSAYDRHGNPLEFEADGFMSKCIQHELDRLDGKIFLDRLSKLKRQRLEKKLKDEKRTKSRG